MTNWELLKKWLEGDVNRSYSVNNFREEILSHMKELENPKIEIDKKDLAALLSRVYMNTGTVPYSGPDKLIEKLRKLL